MVGTTEIQGHLAVSLENDQLRVTVLPGKGADIFAFVHKPSGVDVLMKTPQGLGRAPSSPPKEFLENYEGGWQELFPSVNDACTYRGRAVPFHGEVALLPWDWSVKVDNDHESAVLLKVRTHQTPWRLERLMRVRQGGPELEIEETAWNESDEAVDLVWGHHVVLGAPFLDGACELDIPGTTAFTPDELYEPATAQLAPAQESSWPWARGRRPDERVDLRTVLGPEARVHDEAYITGLRRGHASVTNPRFGLRFSLDWDAAVFRWVVVWRPFGGADLPPLTGIYGLGVEPWVSRHCLTSAAERGEALTVGPRASISVSLRASLEQLSR